MYRNEDVPRGSLQWVGRAVDASVRGERGADPAASAGTHRTKILLTANSSFKLANFRERLIRDLAADGHELVALVPEDGLTPQLRDMSVRVLPLEMDPVGTSPFREGMLVLRIARVMRNERPDAVLGYTIKNNIYGALAARWLGIPFLPNVTGLGSAFDRENWLSRLVRTLYRATYRNCPKVFLQNPDDLAFFLQSRLVRADQAVLLPGSGVDLDRFRPAPLPGTGGAATFLLVARMLRDKGVFEFADAASALAAEFPEAKFQLLGPLGTGKAGGLDAGAVERLVAQGNIDYLGTTEDVRPFLAAADAVVLPSYYREGTPRALLEAAAMARVVITTDMPGCRDAVAHGETGFLCRPRDSEDLARRMRQVLLAGSDTRTEMGRAGRRRMEERFDETLVVAAYRQALAKLVPRPASNR